MMKDESALECVWVRKSEIDLYHMHGKYLIHIASKSMKIITFYINIIMGLSWLTRTWPVLLIIQSCSLSDHARVNNRTNQQDHTFETSNVGALLN